MKLLLLWTFLAINWVANGAPVPQTPASSTKFPGVPQNGAIVNFKGPAYFVERMLRVAIESEDHLYVKKNLKLALELFDELSRETNEFSKFTDGDVTEIVDDVNEEIVYHLKCLINGMSSEYFLKVGEKMNDEIKKEWKLAIRDVFANKTRIKADKLLMFLTNRGIDGGLHDPQHADEVILFSSLTEKKNGVNAETRHADFDGPKSITKRSWFPIFGYMFKGAIATATDGDVTDLAESMQMGINTVLEENGRIVKRLSMLTKSLEFIAESLSKLNENDKNTVVKLSREKLSFAIIDAWQELLSVLRFLNEMFNSAQLKIQLMEYGESPAILTVKQAKLLIKKGEEIFDNLVFPGDFDPTLPDDQKIQLPAITVERTYLTGYTIAIPFFNPKHQTKLYELESFPFETTEGRLRVPQVDKRIAVAEEEYTILPESKECKLINGFYLCDFETVWFSLSIPNCAVGYVTQKDDIISRQCMLKKPNVSESEMFTAITNDRVYVYFPRDTKVTVECSSNVSTTKEVLERVRAIMFTETGCKMQSEFGDYESPKVSFDKVQFDVESIPMRPIDLTFFNDAETNDDLLQQQINETRIFVVKLREVGENLGVDKIFGTKLSKVSWILSSITSIVIIVAVVAFIVYKCVKSK